MDKNNQSSIDENLEHLRTMCRMKGLRVTPQRIEIYKYLLSSCSHPDAETVFEAVKEKIPNVSVDTVYRTLTSLEDMNLIFRVDNQLPRARFDADKTPHFHFLCTECNEVYDIFPQDNSALSFANQLNEFGEIKDINIQVRGVCRKCLKKSQ